jgi:hypothetical protein
MIDVAAVTMHMHASLMPNIDCECPITKRSTEVAELGAFGIESQSPRLGYRGRYLAQA